MNHKKPRHSLTISFPRQQQLFSVTMSEMYSRTCRSEALSQPPPSAPKHPMLLESEPGSVKSMALRVAAKEMVIPIIMMTLLIISRMISDIPNFTATIALIMFTSYLIRDKLLSVLVILVSQIISDLYIGIYSSMFFVYGAYVFIALLSPIIMNKLSFKSVLISSLVTPTIFYIVSNFGVWITGSTYPLSLDGLIMCYVAGIPFFDETLLSTVVFSVTIYAMMKLIVKEPEKLILIKK